jgi:hypothetical protein
MYFRTLHRTMSSQCKSSECAAGSRYKAVTGDDHVFWFGIQQQSMHNAHLPPLQVKVQEHSSHSHTLSKWKPDILYCTSSEHHSSRLDK